jgi:hypothetical protein
MLCGGVPGEAAGVAAAERVVCASVQASYTAACMEWDQC